jgi:prophage DNA circulation protein
MAEIDRLTAELQAQKIFLQSEGERIQRETARYVNFTQMASASVKIIFDTVSGWREAGHPMPEFEIMRSSAKDSTGRMERLDDFGASNLPQATERAFLDCQLEEDALYTTAVASAPGNTQAIVLVRAAVEQLKAKLKAELLAAPRRCPQKNSYAVAQSPSCQRTIIPRPMAKSR